MGEKLRKATLFFFKNESIIMSNHIFSFLAFITLIVAFSLEKHLLNTGIPQHRLRLPHIKVILSKKNYRLSLGLASMFNLPRLMPFLPFPFALPGLGILLPAAGLLDGEGASAAFSDDAFIRCFFALG